MRVAAIIGPSGSGKTGLITALIRKFVTAGRTVGAIKHTHHPLNEERRGDTARFAEAGAEPVVFAGAGEAVIFRRESIARISYTAPRDLLDQFDTDIVLIEGFKSLQDWPRIELPIDLDSAAAMWKASENAKPARGATILRCDNRGGMLRYRAVLFDLDGTLVDSYAALADAVNYARRQHELHELTAEAIRGFVGEGLERLLQRAFEGTVPPGATEAFENRYGQICGTQSKVLPDVEQTLGALKALNVAMAVCTNKPTAFSRKILETLELGAFFREIVGPDVAGARKPQREHVLRTLQATHCKPSEALFVGDMPIDVQAARNSGLDVAVVASGSSTAAALKAARPNHYLDRLADLVQIVRNGASA